MPAPRHRCPTCARTDYTYLRDIHCSQCDTNKEHLVPDRSAKIMEHWFQTHTGKLVDVRNPTPDMVDLEDIAHALSMICRFAGHVREFYSVAEHSVLVAMLGNRHDLSPEFNLALLLHDAAETYIGDIISPVKRILAPTSNSLEQQWLRAIEEKFNLGDRLSNMDQSIHKADRLALSVEVSKLFYPVDPTWWTKFEKPTKNQLLAEIHCFSPADARRRFLQYFNALDSARTSASEIKPPKSNKIPILMDMEMHIQGLLHLADCSKAQDDALRLTWSFVCKGTPVGYDHPDPEKASTKLAKISWNYSDTLRLVIATENSATTWQASPSAVKEIVSHVVAYFQPNTKQSSA